MGNCNGTAVTITDNESTNEDNAIVSATAIASQQSIKAYVDAEKLICSLF